MVILKKLIAERLRTVNLVGFGTFETTNKRQERRVS